MISFLSVSIPYRIPFEDDPDNYWAYTDIVIDFTFWVDILFNFLTAYEDDNGVLVSNKAYIAKNYIQHWFLIDSISSLPFSVV